MFSWFRKDNYKVKSVEVNVQFIQDFLDTIDSSGIIEIIPLTIEKKAFGEKEIITQLLIIYKEKNE